MSKIIIDGKKYERIKVKGKENCNDCDLAKKCKKFSLCAYLLAGRKRKDYKIL